MSLKLTLKIRKSLKEERWLNLADINSDKFTYHSELGLRNGRKVDMAFFWDYPGTNKYNLAILGIEIKSDKLDLYKDEKIKNYLSSCNYFYLAAPWFLCNEALSKTNNIDYAIGLIVLDEKEKLHVVKKATFRDTFIHEGDLNWFYHCHMTCKVKGIKSLK